MYRKFLHIVAMILVPAALAARAGESAAPVRVALMDFSVDDNSYRSAQSAIDFTSLVQVQLANAAGIDWIERAQLSLARKEIGLTAMSSFNGAFNLRCGKWLKADWMITGRFSSDDRNRRTLFLEITELQHADVLASGTFEIPGDNTSPLVSDPAAVQFVAGKLRGLLADARGQQQRKASQIVIAPLFFTDTSHFSFSDAASLQSGFSEALERAAATNRQVRLVHFPKAYQAIEESEMTLDGLIDSKAGAWQPSADLFVWGTYAVTNMRSATGGFETKYLVSVNAWDGSSPPLAMSEMLDSDSSFRQNVQAPEASRMLGRMAGWIIGQARKQKVSPDSVVIRHQIADSIVNTYLAMSEHGSGWMDSGQKLAESVHMLETACFFDPGNSNAQLLRVTCRWGSWVEFSAKNEFWSRWRRSQAWGKYVERFGLAPLDIKLPFPNNSQDFPHHYLEFLREVIHMCPRNFDWSESDPDGPMKEAQRHGFPTEISNAVAAQWKAELESEYWDRLNRVVEFASADDRNPRQRGTTSAFSAVLGGIFAGKQPPQQRLALLEKIWPACVTHSKLYGRRWIIAPYEEALLAELCTQAGRPDRGAYLLSLLSESDVIIPTNKPAIGGIRNISSPTNGASLAPRAGPLSHWPPPGFFPGPVPGPPAARQSPVSTRIVPSPKWFKEIQPNLRMFDLTPPVLLPKEVKPDQQEFRFPERFEVKVIDQLDLYQGRLLILATDERSAPSGDAMPDVSAEVLRKRGRMWSLGPGDLVPQLFEERLLPPDIHWFLRENGQLWVAGQSVGRLDLSSRSFQSFGLHEGFSIAQPGTLAMAGGDVFAAEYLHLSRYERETSRWKEINIPMDGNFSSPCFLVGNSRELVLIAGTVHLYNVADGSWTKVPNTPDHYRNSNERMGLLAEENGFWFGTDFGLYFYDAVGRRFQSWRSPVSVQGLVSPSGFPVMGGDSIPEWSLNQLDEQLQGRLLTFRKEHARTGTARLNQKSPRDPLGLDARVPQEITALARDGEFIWIGAGKYVLLLHEPSRSLVACSKLDAGFEISSLAVSDRYLWVGTAYSDQQLVRLSKDAFLSVPESSWSRLAISPEEREQIVRRMNVRDQALYAFYAGDDARVVELLGNVEPEKASLEQMFLLAFSYDASGLNQSAQARAWYERIISRYPDSPWAKAATELLAVNEQDRMIKEREAALLRKFDRNHDGVLDATERSIMENDSAYRREEAALRDKQLDAQMAPILKRFDVNLDGKLDQTELTALRNQVLLFAEASPELLAGRKLVVAPFISKNFPSESAALKKYDANSDGGLDAGELKALARDIRPAQ